MKAYSYVNPELLDQVKNNPTIQAINSTHDSYVRYYFTISKLILTITSFGTQSKVTIDLSNTAKLGAKIDKAMHNHVKKMYNNLLVK